ncbi:MAG TPA: hypothetical protein VFU07_05250 [Candidatus Lumbricidophila sp.]|nr:hypothetical protein [Candidatus Lumbricidophila sp.]
MKIAPLSTRDPWFTHVFNHGKAYVETLQAVPVDAVVLMEHASFIHQGSEQNFRPVLHLEGQLISVSSPQVELPFGVTQLEFPSGQGASVDAFYEFTNEQLAQLAQKGYFEKGFEIPAALAGVPWTLPGTAKFVFVSPDANDEPPVVFLELLGANQLVIDERTSGYEIVQYFPVYAPESKQQAHEHVTFTEPMRSNDQVLDLFADEVTEPAVVPNEASAQDAELVAQQLSITDAERRYQENVARRLQDPERLKQGIPLFEDVEFELDDSLELKGEVVFDLVDDELVEDEVYVLLPHQRASFQAVQATQIAIADAEKKIESERSAALAAERDATAAQAEVSRIAALQVERERLAAAAALRAAAAVHAVAEPDTSSSSDLELD